jgi:uncharacterized protein YcbK (DUF882 family)
MASKYAEDEMFLNYGKDTNEVVGKCEKCEKIKKKLERKVSIKQNTIDVLERELRDWKDSHWKLVKVNCQLRDKIQALKGIDTSKF